MKILLLTLLLSSSAQAANFATIDELKTQVVNIYTDQKYCPSDCIQIDGHDPEISDVVEIMEPICTGEPPAEVICNGEKASGRFELKESPVKKAAKLAKLKAEQDKIDAEKLVETEALSLKAKGSWTAAERDKLIKYLLSR